LPLTGGKLSVALLNNIDTQSTPALVELGIKFDDVEGDTQERLDAARSFARSFLGEDFLGHRPLDPWDNWGDAPHSNG
jgi:hypothetical protein